MVVFVFGIYKGEGFKEVLSFTVVLIIASIPMAVEIVTTTTLALGARKLAEEGAIVTRLRYVSTTNHSNHHQQHHSSRETVTSTILPQPKFESY